MQRFYGDSEFHKLIDIHIGQLGTAYSWLKALGCEDVTERIDELLVVEPEQAYGILRMYKQFVTDPALDPLGLIVCSSLDFVQRMARVESKPPAKATQYPCEAGSFLLKTLSPVPEGFEACRILIDRYASSDLNSLMVALSKSVGNSDSQTAKETVADLNQVFGNAWKEAQSMRSRINYMSYGISLTLSAFGYVAGGIWGRNSWTLGGSWLSGDRKWGREAIK